jgi:DNA polymerase-4
VTQTKKGPASASLIAREIKKEIFRREGLIASAGVSYNKFLAKIASDMDKPDGFYLIEPADAEDFIEDLDIELFFGVGERTAQKMHGMNIHKGRDLKSYAREELIRHFGKAGNYFYDVVRGLDDRPVVSFRERKSIGAERTYERDLYDMDLVREKMTEILDILWKRYEGKNKHARTLTLKLRFSDFTTITRSTTQDQTYSYEMIRTSLMDLLPGQEIKERGVRLLGASLSNFQVETQKSSDQMKINFESGDP